MAHDEREHVKQHIELAIERARDGVTKNIDELDRRLRTSLDVRKIAGEHAVQLMAAGAATGFLLGFGAPKLLTRLIALGVPVMLAVQVARKQAAAAGEDEPPMAL